MSILDQKTFIAAIPPFDKLQPQELEAVTAAMDIAYFKTGEVLMQQGSVPTALYIIIKGIVHEMAAEEMVSVYVSQDSFDAIALLKGESTHDFLVQEEVICYVLPKTLFLTLIEQNIYCKEFYYQDLSKRLNTLIEQRHHKVFAPFMIAKIKAVYLHPPVYVDAQTSVYEAVSTMARLKANFILVNNPPKIGIVTDKDLRDHVVLQRYAIDDAVGGIATYDLIEMTTEDFLLHALLVMIRHTIKHLLIREKDTILGVLEQIDLLSYLSNHTRLVAVQIERAQDKAQLQAASQHMTDMIKAFQANGMKIRHLSEWVSELNQQIFKKLYTFIMPTHLAANACFVVMGSEGRGEQILKTDQDNALILRHEIPQHELEEIAQTFTETLIDFGYPPCPGQVMINNPRWCQSLAQFKETIFQWVVEFRAPLMELAIFCDAQAVAGDATLLTALKTYLYARLQDNQAFFAHFAKPTLAFETPLSLFATFVVDKYHKNQMDIKKGGIFPIVHGIRSLALEHRLQPTNTLARIKALTQHNILDKAFADDLQEALDFMISLRLQFELEKIAQGEAYDNYIKPNQLNKLERDLLKDSLKIVNDFKKFIVYHFKLDSVT